MLLAGLLVALAQTAAEDAPVEYDARDYGISYIVTSPMTVRAAPEVGAKVVGQLRRFDLPRVIKAQPGWAHVLYVPPKDSSARQFDGWIAVGDEDQKDHLADFLDAALRVNAAKQSTWTVTIQNYVATGRVRPGFTKEQVKAAHKTLQNISGQPLSVRTSETATGVREVWAYPGRLFRLEGGKVVEIETQEQ